MSDRQVTACIRAFDCFSAALVDDLATIRDMDMVGEFAEEIKILFHKQNRHCDGIAQRAHRPADIPDGGKPDAVRRLVENEDFRPYDQGQSSNSGRRPLETACRPDTRNA